jgi:cysteine desulfurase
MKKENKKKENSRGVAQIYMDHAATTPVDKKVIEAMMPFFDVHYGNPSSLHAPGQIAAGVLAGARESIAKHLNAHADEMVFCSGGTESDNLSIMGVVNSAKAELCKKFGKNAMPHVITSAIEHPAVLEPLLKLEYKGLIKLTQIKP